ncbi:MAG: tetratricopeptide repeat protein [Chloroflexota bacterium]|nr:tetratricopeptide repeat protein [Chloroflexota bacterium]
MRFLDVLKYLGEKVVIQDIAGEFADLNLLSQQVNVGAIIIRQDSSEVVAGCQDGNLIVSAEVTSDNIMLRESDSWTDVPVGAGDKVSLLQVPMSLIYLLLGMPPKQGASTLIASQIPLTLAVQLVQRKAEDGTYCFGVEQGTLLLRIDEAGQKAVWTGESGVLIEQEAVDFALNFYGDGTAISTKVSLESKEEKIAQSQALLASARTVWTEEQDTDKALELAQQAIKTLPVEAHDLMSRVYRATGEYDKAVQELEMLVQQNLATEETYGRIARLYEEQGKVVRAVKALRSALDMIDIDGLQILRYIVAIYTKHQMVTELIETLDEIISRCESAEDDQARERLHWAMHRKGLAFQLKGDAHQSLVFLEKAIEIAPEDIGPYQDLAKAYRELDNPREALSVLRRGLEIVTDPEARVKAFNTIAHIHISLQEHQDAVNTYQQILELDSANFGALLQLGQIHYQLGNMKQARKYFQEATEVSPEHPMAQNYLMKLRAKVKTTATVRQPTAGFRDEVHLRGEPRVDDLFAVLHSKVKRELTLESSKLDEETEVVADGWSRYSEGIRKGRRLKSRTSCFQDAAQFAKETNDSQLFALAAAQYCQVSGYFEFRFRGDHQAARHVYYRSLVRLLRQMTAIPKSMAVSYRPAINAYLFSCLGVREAPVPWSTDEIVGDILEDSQAIKTLKEEVAFLAEEHPSLIMEIANWLKGHKTVFMDLCVSVIQQLTLTRPYEAFSALLRLDRDATYFGTVVHKLSADQASQLARAIIDFGDPTATTPAVRKSLPRFVEALDPAKWNDQARQEFAFEALCYRRSDSALAGLQELRGSLLRTALQLKKRRGERVFLQKMLETGNILARFQAAQTPQDKFLYGKQIDVEVLKAVSYAGNVSRDRIEIANKLVARIKNSVQEGIADISMYPDVTLDLTTSRLPYFEEVGLYFNVRNTGFGPAEDVRMRVTETDQFITSQAPHMISVLSAGSDTTWELKIHPLTPPGELTLEVTVFWRNVQKRQDSKVFDFVATFYPEEEFQKIPQRYIPGKPIKDPAMFYGRTGIVEEIIDNLKGLSQDNVLVLHGQRRVGKTSLLYNLEYHDLRGPYMPVFIDMQELSGSSTARLCSKLANSVLNALRARDMSAPTTDPFLPTDYFSKDPLGKLGEFFDQTETLQDVRILLLIDEFESLMRTIRDGTITEHFYNFLRGLMQHKMNVSFIFAGADELQEMMRDYASVMFNIARFIPIGYMSPEEAEYLIRKPVEGFLAYEDSAVGRIEAATAGNPYYIQLICFNLVERMNREKRNTATIVDVNEVIRELLQFGSSYFEHLWRRLEPLENILLACLAELADPVSDRWVGYVEILDRIRRLEKRYDVKLALTEEGTLLRVTKILRDRGVIEERRREEEIDFRIRVDLFREWFKAYQPLERTVKEVLADA